MIPTYSAKIVQKVNLDKLTFPSANLLSESYYSDDCEIVSNDLYVNMQGWDWKGYQYVYGVEKKIVDYLNANAKTPAQYEKLIDKLYEKNSKHIDDLDRLDVGVASLVAALSAYGCAPLTSCSGHPRGAKGVVPNVVFFSHEPVAKKLLDLAITSKIGLENLETDEGYTGLMIYSNSIVGLMDFSQTLYKNFQ